ncbi:MAG TPA: hypothetical protein VKU02_02645 [Gemmataceae bacterium]|nr:hypothetical protein [Gemmataceae bacterium]
MNTFAGIFSEFNLPNATTWFYFSLLLAVALFFKFTRLVSVRNWDVLTLFLLVPGLLLIQEGHSLQAARTARAVAAAGQNLLPGTTPFSGTATLFGAASLAQASPEKLLWFGFLWLLCGSVYLLIRCLMDLALVRRPALSPNLNLSGLLWLGAALLICLTAVALRKPFGSQGAVGKRSAAVKEIQRLPEDLLNQEIAPGNSNGNTQFWVERTSAILCHIAIVVALAIIGWRHFQDAHAGIAAATFYLLLPYTAYHVEQVHHVLPTALLMWAVAAYRRPCTAGLLLGLAAGTGYFPAFLFPAWLSFYWRRGAGRFAAAFALAGGLCLAVIAGILWAEGDLALRIQSTLSLSDWQPWIQPSPETIGFWTGVRWAWAYRMPVFVAYLAFVVATLFWPWPKNLAHLLALSAAVLIGIQFWFADQGGVYLLWYLPLLLLLVFRPNLADREALPLHPETDWLTRFRRSVGRLTARLLRLPEPVARVH